MKRCKHKNVRRLTCVSVSTPYKCRRCVTCGAWLSLGPSDDEPAEVRVEIRAAELATAWKPIGGARRLLSQDESTGWMGWPYRQPINDAEHTGFLVTQILNHAVRDGFTETRKVVEQSTAEAIAVWLDGKARYFVHNRNLGPYAADLAASIRSGAWRKETP